MKNNRRGTDVVDMNKYIISHDQLKFEDVIGTGGYGEVFIGYHIPSGLKVAIKKLYALDDSARTKELYQREVEILASNKSVFLLPFVGYTDTPPFCIVTKYIANGSLYKALHDEDHQKCLTPTEKTLVAYGIAAGMQFLHDKNIIHRDLKTQNILLDENNIPVICDFGSSRVEASGGMTGSFGTPNYMAPEFIQSEDYNLSVDVYSFGLILWEILTEEVPFTGLESAQVIYNVVIQQSRPPIPDNTPAHLRKLIERCWSPNPQERPTFSQIVALFEDGTVEFLGCNHDEYQKLLKAIAPQFKLVRRHSDANLLASIPVNEEITNIQLSRDIRNIKSTANFYQKNNTLSLSQCANEYLIALKGNNMAKIKQAIEFFESFSEDSIILSIDIWPSLLSFFDNEHPIDIQKRAEVLLLKLAGTYEVLVSISHVPDLHKYVKPELLDLFLYIVNYIPNLIEISIVDKLFELFEDENNGVKAITLICRIIQNSPAPSLSKIIINRLKDNLVKYSNVLGGHLILELLIFFKYWQDEAISAFNRSKYELNIVSSYRVLFAIQGKPDVFSLPIILDHCLLPNKELREEAYEFIRRYAFAAEGEPLIRLVVTLFEAILKYESEKASLLLIRIAADPERCASIMKSGYIEDFLEAKPSTAVVLLKIFLTIINTKDRHKKYFFQHPLISTYFANIMKTEDEDAIVALCWSLNKTKMSNELANSLVKSEFIPMLCLFLAKKIDFDPQKALWCFDVIAKVAPFVDCANYCDVVQILLELIDKNSEISYHCIVALASISSQVSTHSTIVELNIIAALNHYIDNGESRLYQAQIFKNLRKSGQMIIP